MEINQLEFLATDLRGELQPNSSPIYETVIVYQERDEQYLPPVHALPYHTPYQQISAIFGNIQAESSSA